MEESWQLTARQNTGRTSAFSRASDSLRPQTYELLDTEHPSQPVRQPLRRRVIPGPFKRILSYAWAMEILSLVIAILSLAAIYITLAIHSNRPLPQWPKAISINSLISIFTVVLKATLLMPVAEGIGQLKWHWFHQPRSLIDLDRVDAASRGPWGSFLLIFTTYRHSLAVFGALITIIALAIGPFSQQVLQYDECLQPIPDGIAYIRKANSYTKAGSRLSGDSVGLDNTMAAALYVGLIQPPANATSSIPFECSTGNCTIPEDQGANYSSLAMCSNCTDISATISRNITQINKQFVAYSLPSGPKIGWANNLSSSDLHWMSSAAYSNLNTTRNRDYISAFDALMYRTNWTTCPDILDRDQESDIDPECGYEPFAVSCSIYPCRKTYTAHVTNSVLYEKLLSTTRIPMASASPQVNSSGYTLTGCFGADPDSSNDCLWSFGWESTQALSLYLFDLFSGDPVHSTLEPFTPDTSTGKPWQMRLFSNGNATNASANAYMEGLANAMTSIIRQYGDPPYGGYVEGFALDLQTCIKVQWAWLALPSVLIALAIVFLLLTILETRSWNMKWKSSALALLFYGLDARSRQQYGGIMDLQTMKDTAGQLQAKLARSEAGWQFVIEQEHPS
ncbi:hypothetical protein MMC07_009624 [Pseudocyphellaria aurata]|nr:hypothetical protein [Pseudocyphellaria aurata]